MSLDPLSMQNSVFQRTDLDSVGLNPRAREVLETLPLDRDALQVAIDETRMEVNLIETAGFALWQPATELTSGKLLASSSNIAIALGATDIKYDLTNTAVVAGIYGSSSKFAIFSVDAKGRLAAAAEVALNSDNVTEGSTNLFFTSARALAGVSVAAPATSSSPGTKGQIATSPGFLYQCVATNTWERVATATF